MIRSMTGYSKGRTEGPEFSLSVSVKSTNHRYFDLQLRLPASLEALDPWVRRLVKDHVPRGHVELSVSLERSSSGGLALDHRLLAAYVAAYRELRKEFGSSSEPDLISLLRIPGIVASTDGEISPPELERIQQALERVIADSLRSLNDMRSREGEALEREMRDRLNQLAALAENVAKLAGVVPRLYQRRVEERIREALREAPGGVALDPGRLAQEVAYLASRSDVTEELTRLRSHSDQAMELLGSRSDVGKKLDFLLQEMNREANTLLAKTTDVPGLGTEIARQALEMKTEIEKLREQTQNIE